MHGTMSLKKIVGLSYDRYVASFKASSPEIRARASSVNLLSPLFYLRSYSS